MLDRDEMILLRPSRKNELVVFDQIDRQSHASNFITQVDLNAHRSYFDELNITYLSIENDEGELAGYFVLVLESGNRSLEFRRICIDRRKRGVGQLAIKEMESFSKKKFDVKRIWLDVYEDNHIGRHIYQKLGYMQFNVERKDGRRILFYEKNL